MHSIEFFRRLADSPRIRNNRVYDFPVGRINARQKGIDMFKAGVSGNPKGRPKGTFGPRMRALAELDRLMARSRSGKSFAAALEVQFKADPVKFFKAMIIPLMPRKARCSVAFGQLAWWRRFLLSGKVLKKEVCQ